MSLDIPRFKKQKFLSPVLHKNSPKQKILKSSPQYQKGQQNMLIIHPNAEHGFAALVNDNVLSIFKTLPDTKYDFTILILKFFDVKQPKNRIWCLLCMLNIW